VQIKLKLKSGLDQSDWGLAAGGIDKRGRLGGPGGVWGCSFEAKQKDWHFEHQRSTRIGGLTITQRVPKSQWFLVPSPELKVQLNPAKLTNGVRSETGLFYNTHTRVGKVEQDLILDKKHRASLVVDSVKGMEAALMTLTAKLGNSSSVAVQFSRANGAVLKLAGKTSSSSGRVTLASKADIKREEIKLELASNSSTDWPRSGNRLHITLNSTIAMNKATSPTLVLGFRQEM